MAEVVFNLASYQTEIGSLVFGKRLPDAIYVYAQDFLELDLTTAKALGILKSRQELGPEYNVVKLFKDVFKVSFLSYEGFLELPHPILKKSIHFHLSTGQVKRFDYGNSDNPPILHRKEDLLPASHSSNELFSSLTQQEEEAGLYDKPRTIGFLQNWLRLLGDKGLAYEGHQLVSLDGEALEKKKSEDNSHRVHRHRTAISRYNFSRPIKLALEQNLISENSTVFDYGCGLGDDLHGLRTLGYEVMGWDPVFAQDKCVSPADVVNLGYVINVIEDPIERQEALIKAHSLAGELLIVSAMLENANTSEYNRIYGDGVLTTRNTFQKYFQQDELRQYIEDVLHIPEAIAAGPGIFLIFKTPERQQEYLSERSRRHIDWDSLSAKVFSQRESRPRVNLYLDHQEEFDTLWRLILELGRIPRPEELGSLKSFPETICSLRRAHRILIEQLGEEAYAEAVAVRKADLLAYLALSNFQRRVPMRELSSSLQADLKAFFGGYQKANQAALQALFSIGSDELMTELCDSTPFGHLDEQALYFRNDQLLELHPVLRIYVGCGERLYGDIGEFDLIKIHKASGKLTLLRYDDFEGNSVPELELRVKISLPNQSISYFDYTSFPKKQILFHKVRFFNEDHPDYKKMVRHSRKLEGLEISKEGYGPSKEIFEELLEVHKLTPNLYSRKGGVQTEIVEDS
jgi:DNA phosphorothioation-associated putative methyltransferase